MRTLLRPRTKYKPSAIYTSGDLRLLRLLISRRGRLEGEMTSGWNGARSLELDCILALEDAVLIGWGRRLGMP